MRRQLTNRLVYEWLSEDRWTPSTKLMANLMMVGYRMRPSLRGRVYCDLSLLEMLGYVESRQVMADILVPVPVPRSVTLPVREYRRLPAGPPPCSLVERVRR